ncbi:MAG: sigma-70 family RNA polymerase sigma factor [Lachnospiraceae bacterium]|nr:sigma-70 family RNA polymerase sigma factor [Lachnospiraceae bacterium]
MKTSPELQAAVEAYQQGNQDSFNTIYEQSYQYLHTCVIHVVKNEDAAMDMLQETYMEISRSILQLRNTEDFLNWAAMIANRKCFAYLKKQKDVLLYDDSGDDEENGDLFDTIADDEAYIPEEILQDREKQRLMREIIDGLSDMQRLCIIGYYYNEQKQEEIAQELGIPVNTVKTNLSRAKAKIKDAVVELDEKKGTRLYSFAPFMLLFFGREAEACEAAPQSLLEKVHENFGTTSEAAGNAVEGTGQGTVGGSKAAGLRLKTKVILGAVIAGVTVAGTVIGLSKSGDETIQTEAEREESIVAESTVEVSELQETFIESESVADDTSSEETSEPEESNSDILAISNKYTTYKMGNQGVIPVGNDDGQYGLVTYDNQVIVPLEYTDSCEMANDDGQTFFRNDTGSYVFDRDGNELFHTEYTIVSVNDGVVLAMKGEDFCNGYVYYSLDGKVLYESEGEYMENNVAVGMSEGFAFFLDKNIDLNRMGKDGTIMSLAPADTVEVINAPMAAAKEGYYVTKSSAYVVESAGVYMIRSINGTENYLWDISSIYSQENLKFSTSDARCVIPAFYENGMKYYNYGTIMCAYLDDGTKRTYYLVNTAKLEQQSFDTYTGNTDEEVMDFDQTVITEESLIAKADFIGLSSENYWLIQQGDQWGYIDHEGNVMGMYDDAAAFHNGKALIIENGIAYVIDESFNKVGELGSATGVTNLGEVFKVRTENNLKGYLIIIQ